MGGAGLALPFNIPNNYRLNPALLGKNRQGFNFEWPSVGYSTEGVSFNDIRDLLGNVNEGAISVSELRQYGLDFGRRTNFFGANLGLGFTVSGFAAFGFGEAAVETIPNEALRQYDGGNTVPAGSQLDAYGLGYYTIGAAFGRSIPVKEGDLSVGATLKSVRGYYAHKKAVYVSGQGSDIDANIGNGSAIPAGQDTINESGFGADLGFLYSPAGTRLLPHFGLVIENAIRPRMRFDREAPGTAALDDPNAVLRQDDIDPFRTSVNIGAGAFVTDNIMVAVDWIDVTNNAKKRQLALGAEFVVSNSFGAGVGYNSKQGFSIGVNVFGLYLSVADKRTTNVGYGFRF